MSQYIIAEKDVKKRLDKFLAEQCPDFSRSKIKTLIESGKVLVNGKQTSAHYAIKLGDQIQSNLGEIKKVMIEENSNVQFEVLHEENDFIVINKPAGLVAHQGEGHKESDTLANGLIAKYPNIIKVGDDPIRPGIAHRLDAAVSGVMVIAKTQDMFDHLKKQFRFHEVEKEYIAVVNGKVTPESGVIDFPIDRKEGKMVAKGKGQEGKTAITQYETIKSNNKATLLKIETLTGRTHQIRVHLKAKGWPIVGDKMYGNSEAGRLMLHARRLAFKDLQNKRREYIIEPTFSL